MLLGPCPAGVHGADPAELVAGFELLGDALGLCEPGGNEVDLLQSMTVYINEMLCQGVLQQHQSEGVGLMLLQILLPHPSEAADVLGRLGRES